MADNWKTDGNCSDCRKQNYCGTPCKLAQIRRQEEIQHLIKQGISKVMNDDRSRTEKKTEEISRLQTKDIAEPKDFNEEEEISP